MEISEHEESFPEGELDRSEGQDVWVRAKIRLEGYSFYGHPLFEVAFYDKEGNATGELLYPDPSKLQWIPNMCVSPSDAGTRFEVREVSEGG